MSTQFSEQTSFETYFLTPEKHSIDSDLDTNDAASSSSSSYDSSKQFKAKDKAPFVFASEIDVKPKRKIFNSYDEKKKFISEYQTKWKTELCKNFLLKGECTYGNTCCFAHGYQELKTKNNYLSSYKTKPCKKYFLNGYCPYGYRCQYLHQDVKNCPQYYNFVKNAFKAKQINTDYTLPNLYQNILKSMEQSFEFFDNSERLQMFQNYGLIENGKNFGNYIQK